MKPKQTDIVVASYNLSLHVLKMFLCITLALALALALALLAVKSCKYEYVQQNKIICPL